ncbi:hypothetical protein KIN20_030600 [Parelaphostrongylus tenuis]|uniref:Uncharacterized protein n=1 Tax=Parelaphostrongylus tenuis TaxID=148309 RepID=A0AAD5R3Z2_PARTN|nr:hypothetical protein KIN20_030600 [Parelaphostrongylus tenuis]
MSEPKYLALQVAEAQLTAFVQRLVMQTVFDVLERQARSALLPDALISTVLGQLTVDVTYEPMECPAVAITREEMGGCSMIMAH